MLSADKQKIYEQLAQQFIQGCFNPLYKVGKEAYDPFKLIDSLHDLIGTDILLLHTLFRSHFDNREIGELGFLIEFVRTEGIFYYDFTEELGKLLEQVLLITNSLIKEPDVLTSDLHMWYIEEVFDIFFHHVRLNEYSENCRKLYFELSKQILDRRFYVLNQNEELKYSYHHCLYFLQTASFWFLSRKEEFPVLWNQVQEITKAGIYSWLEEDWTKANEQFISEITANR